MSNMKLSYAFIVLFFASSWSMFIHQGVIVSNPNSAEINLDQYTQISNSWTTKSGKIKYKAQQQYNGINIFAAALVIEQDPNDETQLTPVSGNYYETSQISLDITDTTTSITDDEALLIAINNYIPNGDKTDLFGYDRGESELATTVEFTIFENKDTDNFVENNDIFDDKYYLVYMVQFTYSDKNDDIWRPFTIIDAKTGDILHTINPSDSISSDNNADVCYNDAEPVCLTTPCTMFGIGGNPKIGDISHGPLFTNSPQETRDCQVEVFDHDRGIGDCTHDHEGENCEIQDYFINGAPCVICDALAYGKVVFDLYDEWADYDNDLLPLAPHLMPLEFRVHYGNNHENAHWTGSTMLFGDGLDTFYPLVSLDVAAHEVAHGFTTQFSNLVYSGQSGGMNEAYSDLSGEAAEAYSRGQCDWMCGYEIFKDPDGALRYLYDPPLDGRSISDALDFTSGMNVHYSSGVYNKAYYNLVAMNWDVETIWKVATFANQHYWERNTDYNAGLCGLISAAEDLYGDPLSTTDDLNLAFNQNNVYCVTSATVGISHGKGEENPNITSGTNGAYYIYGGIGGAVVVLFMVFVLGFYCHRRKTTILKTQLAGNDDGNYYGAVKTDNKI